MAPRRRHPERPPAKIVGRRATRVVSHQASPNVPLSARLPPYDRHVKDTQRYTIETEEAPSTVRRRIRAHLRTPLVGTAAASIGIPTGDMVVGVIVGNRFRARLIPEKTPT